VAVRKGIPTTSIYGVKGDQTAAYYSLDIVGEDDWRPSQGLLDTDQVAVDFLDQGEVLEVVDVSFKDNRIDVRTVSVESKKVTRGSFLGTTKREPVSTNFKFFLPYPKSKVLGRDDLPAVLAFVEAWIRPFPSERAARDYAARLASGGAGDRPSAAPAAGHRTAAAPATGNRPAAAPAAPAAGKKKEIKAGMTALEVIDVLGRPTEELTFGNQTKWVYPNLTVMFVNGKVSEVKF
jgi:hypothetical protein